MRRRAFLLGLAAAARAAPSRVSEVLGVLASGLSDGDAEAFLRPFDAAMPGFEALRADVHGLVERAEEIGRAHV